MSLTLIIGNKNYSSWSLRPWIAMKVAGIPFAEKLFPLYEPGSREQVLHYSPTGKVPVLIDGDEHVWESLAILEHLAERFPDAGLWPSDRRARSHARVVANEMHGGFQALRKNCTMNLWLPVKTRPQPDEVLADMRRIEAMWADCRARFGQNAEKPGPFLFGAFGAADAMYAPVVARFHTYGLPVAAGTRAYMDAVMALPAWQEWTAAALKEPWIMQHNEPDWPLVRGVAVT
jgi:glutathione S-transferase